jgi:hypothetical protein
MLGDSTMEERAMVLLCLYLGLDPKHANPTPGLLRVPTGALNTSFSTESQKCKKEKYRHRDFDTSHNNPLFPSDTRITYIWLGDKSPCHSLGGLHSVFQSPSRLARIRYVLSGEGSSKSPDFVLWNSGLHDAGSSTGSFHFNFSSYRHLLDEMWRFLFDSGSKQRGQGLLTPSFFWMPTSPKYKIYECTATHGAGIGTTGVRIINQVASEVTNEYKAQSLDSVFDIRYLTPQDGDGHHMEHGSSCKRTIEMILLALSRVRRANNSQPLDLVN